MATPLPTAVADYFAAKNRHDIDAMLASFSADAVVKDEGKEHHGSAAIRSWMEDTTRKYRVTVEVVEGAGNGDAWRVAGLVSGNFPGSPATLHYSFTLAGDGIGGLEIGS